MDSLVLRTRFGQEMESFVRKRNALIVALLLAAILGASIIQFVLLAR